MSTQPLCLDFNHGAQDAPGPVTALIDAVLVARRAREPERNYLGGSRLGVECARALQFEFFHAPVDPGKELTGRKLRIFDRGHWVESYMAGLLRAAGFNLRTVGRDHRQFGFSVLDGQIKGHADGVFIGGPPVMRYPALWENKGLGAKGWRDLKKKSLKDFSSTYYGQIQLYQAYFRLTDAPALFTAVNMDTMDIYEEFIPFDGGCAQELSDRGVRIVQSCRAGDLLPRIANSEDFYWCRWCNWHDRCWSLPG